MKHMAGMVTLLSYHPKYQMFLKFFPFKGGRFDPSAGRHPQSRGYQHTTYTIVTRDGCELLPDFERNCFTL
jgi:hypothetical protein